MFVEASKLEGIYREFRDGVLTIATSLETRPGSDRLTIVLNGYCDRGTGTPPVFVTWPESSPTFGHILRVCDPTLLMADWLRGSCFLGTESADPIPPLVGIANEVARELGVAKHNLIYLGHSGAGFGALKCAIRDPEASGVVINPVAEIRAYLGYQFTERLARVFRPGSTAAELVAEFPDRLSVSASLKPARAAGKLPRLALIQNQTDKSHFDTHYGVVCETLGLPKTGGSDPTGRLQCVTYDKKGGHSMPPEMALIEQMTERLLAAPATSGR